MRGTEAEESSDQLISFFELEFFYIYVTVISLRFLFSQTLLRSLDNENILCWNYISGLNKTLIGQIGFKKEK